jgi:hypothetical protein
MKRALGDVLPLHVFIRQRQVIHIYRNLLKATKGLQDAVLRQELQLQIRNDFRRNKDVKDTQLIKSLLQEANSSLKTLHGMVASIRTGPKSVGSWLDQSENDDKRGRVGEGWPWS